MEVDHSIIKQEEVKSSAHGYPKEITKNGLKSPVEIEKRLNISVNILVPLIYLGALTLAETITTFASPQVGMILHGVILVALILHSAVFAHHGLQKFLITLTLAPLIRLMSLSLPLLQFPLIYWYALIGAPLLLAAFLVLRLTGFKADRIGLNLRHLPWQLAIGLTGVVFGFMEYIILHPSPLNKALSWQETLFPALILLIFTGFLEEFIFRGLIQRGAYGTVGHYGMLYVAVLFAVLHIGYRSLLDVVFVFAVGLFFGLSVIRTGSLLGVTISHGLTNIALYLVIPFLMSPVVNPVAGQHSILITAQPLVATTSNDLRQLTSLIESPSDSVQNVRDWFDHKETQLLEIPDTCSKIVVGWKNSDNGFTNNNRPLTNLSSFDTLQRDANSRRNDY